MIETHKNTTTMKTFLNTQIEKETEKAVFVKMQVGATDYFTMWLPKSQIRIEESRIECENWLMGKAIEELAKQKRVNRMIATSILNNFIN